LPDRSPRETAILFAIVVVLSAAFGAFLGYAIASTPSPLLIVKVPPQK
jgi:hypothetical protein